MKLLISPLSPFVRKVLVTLHETDQTEDVTYEAVQASPADPDPTTLAANPVGKIPALVRNEGPALYDSRVICRFFNDRAANGAGAGLYPETRLWETLTLEATGDAIMDAAVLMVYEGRFRKKEHQSADWVDNQWAKVDRALAALESRWLSHLQGPLDMGQIAVGCALGYLDFRHDARNWRASHGALADWAEGFNAREAMQATIPEA